MTHPRIERQLSAYLDGELLPDDARLVEVHLSTCPICRGELARLRRVKSLMGRVPDVDPPPQLWRELDARIDAEQRRPSWAVPLEALRSAFRRPAAAVAAVAVIALLVVLPLAKGRLERLQAADIGVDVYVREYALQSAQDPFADPAYLGLLISDANLALAGARRVPEEQR